MTADSGWGDVPVEHSRVEVATETPDLGPVFEAVRAGEAAAAVSAPVFRRVDALSGEVSRPSRFFEANAAADAQIAELDELRALRGKTPESKQLAHGIARLLDRYLHDAADADQRTQLINLASLLRHSTAMAAALGSEIAHYEAEALDEWYRADALQQKFDAAEADLVEANTRIQALETALAQAVSERDTARAVGGVR